MATAQRKLKKRKLRNAEYYNFQDTQDMLYAQSRNNQNFYNLMEIVTAEENIKLAYRNIKKNDGSKTAGVDSKTIKNLSKINVEKLTEIVRNKLSWYQPQAVLRVEIPKANDPTKKRPLGIPTIMDRLIQQCFVQVLEPICEAKFHERSNGFRPNRSTEHAIAQSCSLMQISDLHHVVDIDIKGFFDNVSHGKLIKQMWTLGIRDKKLLSIISAMLKAEVAGIGFPEAGTPQGGVISPLLSNIVLNELDWWIASQWEEIPTRHEYTGYYHENGTVSKGNKYKALRTTNLKECYIVRYADDFKIFCRSHKDAVAMFEATKKWLKERLGLDISPEKSKVINLKKSYSEFVGFKLKVVPHGKNNDKVKSTKYIVRSHVKDKSIIRIKAELDRLICNIKFPSRGKRTEYEAISRYNSFVLGVHNYYSIASLISQDFKGLAFSVHKSLKARLQKRVKSKSEMNKHGIPYSLPDHIKERYGDSDQLKFIDKNVLIPIGYVQYKYPMRKKKCVNNYTPDGREEIHSNLKCVDVRILHRLMENPDLTQTIEFNDNRLSLYCAQQGKCAVAGTILDVDNLVCLHKVPKHLGGKDNYKNLLIVTEDVSKLIYATSQSSIKKYMELLKPDSKQINKLNRLRKLANVDNCLSKR